MKTEIYLVRHAQSHPKSGLHHSKWALSGIGEFQASALSRLLLPLGIESVYSSSFFRCLQTIRPFANRVGLDVAIDEGLRERLVAETLIEDFDDIWQMSWRDFDYTLPGCESSNVAQDRFVSAVREIADFNRGRRIVLSTHGNVIGLFLNHIDKKHGIAEAEGLTNPDVLRVYNTETGFELDESFVLVGLDRIASEHCDTPID